MTTVTGPPAAGPPPMRYPRLRMALGIPAAAFPLAAVITIYAYKWGHKMISFARLNDVGILATIALGVGAVGVVLGLIALIALRRRIAYADRMNAAAAAEQTAPAAELAALDAATDAAIDRAYATAAEPKPAAAAPPAAAGYAELGRPARSAYADLGRPAATPVPPAELARVEFDSRPIIAGAAGPRRGGSAVEEMRAAAARASTAAASMGEKLQQLRPVGGDGPRPRLAPVDPPPGPRHAATQAIPVVRSDAERVIAPPAPARRAPSAPPLSTSYPPHDLTGHPGADPMARAPYPIDWPLPAPWASPLATPHATDTTAGDAQ